MIDCLFKDLYAVMKNGCRILGMDCSDIRIKDREGNRSHKSAVYIAFKKHEWFYVGFTKVFNDSKPTQNRPCNTKHSIASHLNKDATIYVFYNLTETLAHVLEAYFIKYSNKPLTKVGNNWLETGYLLNKRREKKWERLIEEYIIHNGNNPFSFAWR